MERDPRPKCLGLLAGGLCVSLGLLGCAKPRPFVTNPKYAGIPPEASAVHVFPLQGTDIRNPDDYADDFTDKETKALEPAETALGRIFFGQLRTIAKGRDLVRDSLPVPQAQDLRDTVLGIPGKGGLEQIPFKFPSAAMAKSLGAEGQWGLQLYGVRFSRDDAPPKKLSEPIPVAKTVGGADAAQPLNLSGGGFNKLALIGYYLLWDYKNDEAVAYGRFHAEASFSLAMTRSDWERDIRTAAAQIVKNSPLH